jgi:hypothetical protein
VGRRSLLAQGPRRVLPLAEPGGGLPQLQRHEVRRALATRSTPPGIVAELRLRAGSEFFGRQGEPPIAWNALDLHVPS